MYRSVVLLMADQPERSFRRTALHECIHAVGLWGHSRHSGDILVPVSLPIIPVIELSEYDVHSRQADYNRTGDETRRQGTCAICVGDGRAIDVVGDTPASNDNTTTLHLNL